MKLKIQTIEGARCAQLYWVSRSEAKDDEIKEFLENDFTLLREQKTLPVFIESGNSNLEEQLYLLMKRNAESKQNELEKAS